MATKKAPGKAGPKAKAPTKKATKGTEKKATKPPKPLLKKGSVLPAFSQISWLTTNPPEDLDEALRDAPAGIPVNTLRVSYSSTRESGVYFARTYRKATRLKVGDVLELVHEFYTEIVPPEEIEAIKAAIKAGRETDAWGYLAEHLLPDPEGPLRMRPPNEHGFSMPTWTDERCRALLAVYSKEEFSTSGDIWEGIKKLLASYKARKEPFPVFPPRNKPPCPRRLLMGDAVFFEGFRVSAFSPEQGVLDVSMMLGS